MTGPTEIDVKNMELILDGIDAHIEPIELGKLIDTPRTERREPINLDGELCYLVAGPILSASVQKKGVPHGDAGRTKSKRGCKIRGKDIR